MKRHLAALLMFVPVWLIAATETPVKIKLAQRSVSASGITPNGNAAVLAVARSRNQIGLQVFHWRMVVRDDDGDGVITIPLNQDLARNSVWAVVDVETGRTSIARPEGSPFTSIAFPTGTLKRDEKGDIERFQTGREFVDAILVRPKGGVWTFAGREGGSNDDDKTPDGKLSFKTISMQSLLGKSSPPPHFNKKDVFIIIDPQRMEYYSTEVSE